jgi:phospholipid/cholesterol/gamma-HCH transport system substrate-binding protein
MENRAHALAAGLFTLLLGLGVIAVAAWFGGDTVQMSNYLLVSQHPVSGLNVQAPVRFRGVTVGKVVSINFNPQDPRTIQVEITVRSDTPLTEGTFAQLGSQGVTGLSYVILDDNGKKPNPLASADGALARIEVRPSFMDSLTTSGQDMVESFAEVAKRINTLLSEDNQKHIVSAVQSLDRVSGRVASLASALEPAARSVPGLATEAGVVLKRADALIVNLNQRVESFERAARGAEKLTDSGVALSDAMLTETLPRLNLLADDLQRAARSLEHALSDLNEQPHSLIFGRNPAPPGPGEAGFGAKGTK